MIDSEPIQKSKNAFADMDRMYRHQRYFYDLTRKYYLLGRDKLLAEMDIKLGDNVLEVGCGTGRNLSILAKRYPNANFFGLDASAAMLETAEAKIAKADLSNANLKTALADSFSYNETFGLTKPFDTVFFSYSISMIPPWRESIENALENLKPGGMLYLVDFYDQKELPKFFQKLLRGWLRKFHVQFWNDLIPFLKGLDENGVGKLDIVPLFRRYSIIAQFRKF
jgi:S-adenosylmethionine-diacylgycerolhomoserine-N-methlytransferase